MPQYNIKYVNPPKPGGSGKFGNLKTVEGQTLFCPAALLNQFQPGMVCEILTQPQKWGNNDVTVVQSGPIGATQQSTPQASVSRGTATSQAENKWMFVTGVTGRAMGSGKFAASEITVLAQEAARAFDLVNRTPSKPFTVHSGGDFEPSEPPGETGDPGPAAEDWR